jgi:murein DD-endopeptidase MepM/ murein hydrolase activator NlpD
MRLVLRISLLLLTAAGLADRARATAFREVSWVPVRIAAGSPCLFRVKLSSAPSSVMGTWQGHQLSFVPSATGAVWYALAGVDVEAKPGNYKLALVATQPDGSSVREERTVLVARAPFKTERLRVPLKYVEPDPEAQARIEADRQFKSVAFKHETEAVEWSGAFRVPVDTGVSEGFGTRRTFNGKLASIHRGLDFHAAPGTPVTAANAGEIVLARELYYEGNCVIIDHGRQFTTIYMHLSQLKVAEGQRVEKGQEIGLSGATGRVTGPHLHVSARWQGASLDPAQLWKLPLPDLPAATLSPATAER